MFLAYHIATGQKITAQDATYSQYHGHFKCVVCGEDCLLVKRDSSPYFRHHDGTPDCPLKSDNSIYNDSEFYQVLENYKRGQHRKLLYDRLKSALEDCVKYDERRILSGAFLEKIPGGKDIRWIGDIRILNNCLSSILSKPSCLYLIKDNIADLYYEHKEQAREEKVNLERQNGIVRDIARALIKSSNANESYGTKDMLVSVTSLSFEITGIPEKMWDEICRLDHEKIIQALKAYKENYDNFNIAEVNFLCQRMTEIIYSVNWQKLYTFWQNL